MIMSHDNTLHQGLHHGGHKDGHQGDTYIISEATRQKNKEKVL